MFRALSIIAAVAALAVSAAPVASAGPSKKPAPRAVSMFHSGFDHAGIDAHSTPLMETSGELMFLRGKAKAPRLTSISDGTSNTMMRSGSRKPPNGRLLDAYFEI